MLLFWFKSNVEAFIARYVFLRWCTCLKVSIFASENCLMHFIFVVSDSSYPLFKKIASTLFRGRTVNAYSMSKKYFRRRALDCVTTLTKRDTEWRTDFSIRFFHRYTSVVDMSHTFYRCQIRFFTNKYDSFINQTFSYSRFSVNFHI